LSVNGAEEDGVDNRVEAPSRTPGDGSGSASSSEGSEAAAGDTGDAAGTPSDSPSASPPTPPQAASQTAPPQAPAQTVPSLMSAQPSASNGSPPNGSQANGSQGQVSGWGGTSPMAAVSGVASGARGLAAKVGASLSGLTTSRTKGQPRPQGQQPRQPSAGNSQGAPSARPPQSGRPQAGNGPQPGSGQQTRSALLSLQRVEPMSVMKFSFLISLVGWVVVFIAVAVIYFTLSKLGVFTKIETTVGLVTFNKNHPGSNASSWFSASRVLEYTALVCTINAILFTALATVGAALYNLVTSLTGGIEVTLRESD